MQSRHALLATGCAAALLMACACRAAPSEEQTLLQRAEAEATTIVQQAQATAVVLRARQTAAALTQPSGEVHSDIAQATPAVASTATAQTSLSTRPLFCVL